MSSAEQSLQRQLTRLSEALDECLKEATGATDDEARWRRAAELTYARKLARASAQLAEALARLKGETRHNVHVTRGDKGGGA